METEYELVPESYQTVLTETVLNRTLVVQVSQVYSVSVPSFVNCVHVFHIEEIFCYHVLVPVCDGR